MKGPMKTRRARPADVAAIYGLIEHYAVEGLLLPRDAGEIRQHFDHFLVLENAGGIVGCVAIEPYGADLAEIRSLALAPGSRSRGLGGRLLAGAVAEAKRRGIARVFAVTHAPGFFLRYGFESRNRRMLPEKIERDCLQCPQMKTCKLSAVVADLLPARFPLRVFEPAAAPPVPA
jgi:amino-acid N-acetyltransferase